MISNSLLIWFTCWSESLGRTEPSVIKTALERDLKKQKDRQTGNLSKVRALHWVNIWTSFKTNLWKTLNPNYTYMCVCVCVCVYVKDCSDLLTTSAANCHRIASIFYRMFRNYYKSLWGNWLVMAGCWFWWVLTWWVWPSASGPPPRSLPPPQNGCNWFAVLCCQSPPYTCKGVCGGGITHNDVIEWTVNRQ